MGNGAIALGALAAGVNVVAGYPGTPSSEIIETIKKYNKDGNVHLEWSINEKAALEVAETNPLLTVFRIQCGCPVVTLGGGLYPNKLQILL